MILRQESPSGMKSSVIGQGTWSMGGDRQWGEMDEKRAIDTIRFSLESGINLIDTALVYGFGRSERLVGKAIEGFDRSQVLIQTKCGLCWRGETGAFHMERDGKVLRRNLTKKGIFEGLEESLSNLGTDYVDIYMTHAQAIEPFKTPIAETMEALMELKRAGRIRGIGVSNCSKEELIEYLKYGPVDVIQEKFSMLDREKAEQLLDICKENGILFQAYSPLEQGLLSGEISMDYVIPQGHVRSRNIWWRPKARRRILVLLEKWNPLCEKYQCSMTALVTSWICGYSRQMVVLAGGSQIKHIKDYIQGGLFVIEEKDWLKMNREIEETIKEIWEPGMEKESGSKKLS
ncbi:MAG: aldo/keto reductase [Lachnospiraceae bacterium]|jgi:methylglyoxal reductase|nr:aldo/keto reductase [Lachnospiraceae bacterium]